MPNEAEETNVDHKVFIERVEAEYYLQIEYDMSKNHYISFIATVYSDKVEMVKLYPETRVKLRGVKKIYYYCNRDGLFYIDVNPSIDGSERFHDDTDKRRQ